VHRALGNLLDRHGGVVSRSQAVAVVDHDVLDRAVRAGRLCRPFPGVFVSPALAAEPQARICAALVYAAGAAALSHVTALGAWQVPVPVAGTIHLVTAPSQRLRGASGLRVHRRDGLRLEPPDVVMRGGFPVTRLERAIVDSWPMLDGDAKRAPAIWAVGQRMTTPRRLAAVLESAPRLAGRRHLVHLVELLRRGCRSPLEVWGYDHVFSGLPLRWQVPVHAGGRRVYLDLYDEVTRVNVELDGAKYHAGAADRERDLRRDAALAALGITVVRFTHDRLVREPDEVRRQVLAILAARAA
jgi:very-short-patch-repair endonuclease